MDKAAEKAHEKIKNPEEFMIVKTVSAALATDGVVRLAGGITNAILKNIRGKDLLSKGVKISAEKHGKYIIDVYVIVGYGTNIPVVAWDLQTNIKNEVEKGSGIKIEKVNVHVQGVYIPEQE